MKTDLDTAIKQYARKPFAVFSSAVPTDAVQGAPHYFKRPDIPLDWFLSSEHLSTKEKILAAKQLKGKKWLKGNVDLILDATRTNLAADSDFKNNGVTETGTYAHNTINRMTGTTGKGRFAPFETTISWFYPGVLLSLFILADPEFLDKESLVKGMSRIGKFGFGRDASTGMGRFTILDTCPLPLPDLSAGDALYTLAPCLPEKDRFNQTWFTPFVRFGKHGDMLAGVRRPFKNPVVMADEEALSAFRPKILKPRTSAVPSPMYQRPCLKPLCRHTRLCCPSAWEVTMKTTCKCVITVNSPFAHRL